MNKQGYANPLSYEQIDKLLKGDKNVENGIINTTNCHLTKMLLDNMPLQLEWEKCYHIKVSLLDHSNVVATIDDVEIHKTTYNVPSHEPIFINRKLNFKERLKILFKGEL